MPGEVDARLIGLLQGSMSLADGLRDAGSMGDITVRLSRADGLALLKLVAGANDAEAEAWSQRGHSGKRGANSLKIASLTFEWPETEAGSRQDLSRVFSTPSLGPPANENQAALRFYRFEEDAPALR